MVKKDELEALEDRVNRQLAARAKAEGMKDDPITDGVVNIDEYIACSPRMPWVLREPWETPDTDEAVGGWSLTQELLAQGRVADNKGALPPIAYVTYSVLNCFPPCQDIPYLTESPEVRGALRKIAYMNVKKFPNVKKPGNKIAYAPDIKEFYCRYRDILLDQIATIDPHIVIFGGTRPLFTQDLGLTDNLLSRRGSVAFCRQGQRLYIEAHHPAQRTITKSQYVDDIASLIKTEWH